LATAAVLASKGQRVLVLERHYTPGGFTHVFRRNRFEWDVGLHYVGGVGRPNAGLRRSFGWLTEGALGWEAMGAVYDRIRFGDDEVYDFPKGATRFPGAMKDHFPGQGDAIDRYMALLSQVGRATRSFFAAKAIPPFAAGLFGPLLRRKFAGFARRTTRETLRELTDDPRLIGVLTGQYGDYGLPPRQSSFAMHAMVAAHYLGGGAYPVGGSGRIVETILPRITRAGGLLLTNAEVAEILVEGGRAVGVRMAADDRTVRAPVVVSGAGAAATFRRLLPRDPDALGSRGAGVARQADGADRVGPSVAHACLYVGLDATADALRLPRANHWLFPRGGYDHDANIARFLEDESAPLPVAYVSFPSAKDPTFEDRYPGRATIEVITLAPWERFAPWADARWHRRGADYEALKERLADRLLAELYRVEPQTRGHVEHAELSTPVSTRHFTGYDRGEIYGLAHSPGRFAERHLGPRTAIPGLFLTGQDVATCGIAGAAMGGLLAATAVTGRNVMGEVLRS